MENEKTQCDEECTHHNPDLKKDVEKLINVLFPPEARQHMIRATTEVILAVDAAMPKGLVPQEVKDQYEVVRRETATLVKTMVHAATNPQPPADEPKSEENEEKGLQKIEFS